RVRKKIEHREQNRHLQQHGNTPTDRIHAHLLIEFQLFLLRLLHVVAMLFLDLVEFRFQHTHLCHAEVRAVRKREQHQLEQNDQDCDDQSIASDKGCEKVKYRIDNKLVNPVNGRPSEIN